jgi:hypothetical protein
MTNIEKIIDKLSITDNNLATWIAVIGMIVKEIKENRFSGTLFIKKLESETQAECFNGLMSALVKVGMDNGQIQAPIDASQQKHRIEVDKYIDGCGELLELLLKKMNEKAWGGSDTYGLANEQ